MNKMLHIAYRPILYCAIIACVCRLYIYLLFLETVIMVLLSHMVNVILFLYCRVQEWFVLWIELELELNISHLPPAGEHLYSSLSSE